MGGEIPPGDLDNSCVLSLMVGVGVSGMELSEVAGAVDTTGEVVAMGELLLKPRITFMLANLLSGFRVFPRFRIDSMAVLPAWAWSCWIDGESNGTDPVVDETLGEGDFSFALEDSAAKETLLPLPEL